MNNLIPIEQNNQRVLLTNQIAEFYGTTDRRISENFVRNQERYQEGKHFYYLNGEKLKQFKSEYANCVVADNVNKLYLWTEKGALLHAKSLNTDKAWQMYDILVDTYFNAKQQIPRQLSQAEILAGLAQVNVELERKVLQVEQKANHIEDKLNNTIEILSKSSTDCWKEDMNKIINRLCSENILSYSSFKGDLYKELEDVAQCRISARQSRLRSRMEKAGATYKERQAISKIDVISRDPKLRAIFEGIVKQHQARFEMQG